MRFVLDASVALRWLIEEEKQENGELVLTRLLSDPGLFAVPELFSYEVFSVLYRLHPRAEFAYEEVILPILAGGILRYPMTPEIARKAGRYLPLGLTGYDACYAAVAEELEARWLTFDKKAHRLLADREISVNLWEALPEGW